MRLRRKHRTTERAEASSAALDDWFEQGGVVSIDETVADHWLVGEMDFEEYLRLVVERAEIEAPREVDETIAQLRRSGTARRRRPQAAAPSEPAP